MATVVAIGVGLAALAGVVLAPIRGVHPAMGSEIITAAFVIVVIGGLGSFWGVVLASIVVGVVRGLTGLFRPTWPRPRCTSMFLVLLVRPRGLLGERFERLEA